MAAGKEIRGKIKSVENTARSPRRWRWSPPRRCGRRRSACARRARTPRRMRSLAANLVARRRPSTGIRSWSRNEDAKTVGFIVVTTDKGLCGGLNTNVLRAAHRQAAASCEAEGVKVEAVAIGNKGLGFLNRIGAKVVSHVTQLGDPPQLDKLIGPVKVLLDAYVDGKLDAVYLCYTRFINTMKQEPVIAAAAAARRTSSMRDRRRPATRWDYIYEPDARGRDRRAAHALHRGARLPGRGREHGVRAVGAHGGDEGGDRQRRQRHRRAEARSTTRRARRRSPRNCPRSSPARRRFKSYSRYQGNNMADMQPSNAMGKIVQCIGAVVDVEFPRDQMPKIYDALKMEGTALTLEVQQQLGDGVVRTIALGSSDGLRRGMMVNNTGAAITVPVGPATLGRIMDVLGNPIDERGPVEPDADRRRSTASRRPSTSCRRRRTCSRPASRSSTWSARSPRAARSACSAAPASARPST